MYQYPVEKCDVRDLDRLRKFREKRAEWISWLHGDDPHSIWGQIHALLWDDVLFRTVNDLRRHAIDFPSGRVGFNSAVLRMFDAGFVTTQVTAIRRLTDPQWNQPHKGVISLRRLIDDIRNNRQLMTRELYVSYDGLPYEPAPVRDAWVAKRLASGNLNGVEMRQTTGPGAWGTSELVHEGFDKLAKSSGAGYRSRTDLVSKEWFDWLDTRLDICDDVRKFADKFVAHAAEPHSRAGLTDAQTGVSLDRLRECHKVIYQVAAFINGPLLWESSHGTVPTPQYNHLENIEKGWIAQKELSKAHEYWNRNLCEITKWEAESLWPSENDGGDHPQLSGDR